MGNVALLAAALLPAAVSFAQNGPPEGLARGTVITTGEDRVVIERMEAGGQMTLEAGFIRNDAGRWVRNKHQMELIGALKPGDKVVARWKLGESHYMIQEMARLGPDGKPLRRDGARRKQPKEGADMNRELQSLRAEVTTLKQEIAELRKLVQQLLEAEE